MRNNPYTTRPSPAAFDLSSAMVDELIPYNRLPANTYQRKLLLDAERRAGRFYQTVRGQGWKRCETDNGLYRINDNAMNRIKSAGKTGVVRLTHVVESPLNLSPDQQRFISDAAAKFELAQHLTSSGFIFKQSAAPPKPD